MVKMPPPSALVGTATKASSVTSSTLIVQVASIGTGSVTGDG